MNAGHIHSSSNPAAGMEAGSRPVHLLSGFLTLGVIQRELPGPLTSLIPTSIQLGYAAGLFLLVPVGDLLATLLQARSWIGRRA